MAIGIATGRHRLHSSGAQASAGGGSQERAADGRFTYFYDGLMYDTDLSHLEREIIEIVAFHKI